MFNRNLRRLPPLPLHRRGDSPPEPLLPKKTLTCKNCPNSALCVLIINYRYPPSVLPPVLQRLVRPREGNAKMKKKRLGENLYERGQISAADLKKALLDQQGRGIHLRDLLLRPKLGTQNSLTAPIT